MEELERLEIKVSYLENLVDELNKAVIEQDKTIMVMQKQIESLEKKVEDLIEVSGEARPNRRPERNRPTTDRRGPPRTRRPALSP